MSVQAIGWVLENARTRSVGDRLVLISVANHADRLGRGAFPKIAYVATECRMSERQVIRCLKRLESDGIIAADEWPFDRTEPARNRRPNCWRILGMMPGVTGWHPQDEPGVTTAVARGDNGGSSGVTSVGTERARTVLEPSITVLFDQFWKVYPKKVAKRAAERDFAKATIRAPFAEILAGAVAYRDNPERNPRFTKDPTTWLNGDCWADEPAAAAPPTVEPEYHFADEPDAAALEAFADAAEAAAWSARGKP